MNLLLLKGFNNYFNRKIKKYSTLDDYKANSSKYYIFSDINFNPNDGVVTEQVIGSENQKDSGNILDWEDSGSPDYVIAYKTVPGTTIVDGVEVETAVDEIVSRWFVLESVRTRAGQYRLALKRDIIADHLEQILTNPCFVEKGYVKADSPLIFNEEGVNLNEIKQSETMLKDETGIPWIVMYIAKNYKRTWVEAQGDTPAHWQEETVPIEGQMVLDTSQALDVSDLPWYNIIPSPAVGKTYRVKGASGICISPIMCEYINATGFGKYLVQPVRANMRYYYQNNQWVINKTLSKAEKIGTWARASDSPLGMAQAYLLLRKAINLTPANDSVRWNSTGICVPSYWAAASTTGGSSEIEERYTRNVTMCNFLCQYAGLGEYNTEANKTKIRNYLTSKMNSFKSNTSHSTVPGQTNMEAYVGGNQTFIPEVQLLSYNNKLVKSGADYYRLRIKRQNVYRTPINYFTDVDGTITPSGSGLEPQDLTNLVLMDGHTVNSNNDMVETWLESGWFDIQYEKVSGDLLRFTLPTPTSRNSLNDAAYDMVAFPYGAIDFIVPNDNNPPTANLTFTSTAEASIGIARSIASAIGDALYDMQLLPYCPYREVAEQYAEDGYIDIGKDTPFTSGAWSGVYKINNPGETPSRSNSVSFGLWCISSHGTFDIRHVMEVPTIEDSIEYKLFNACKKFRLVAPNYSSVFEFNPLKNNGVTIFNVDFTYKPYNPYIHIAPFFNSDGLYGVDTNDNRGLSLQGDFSVGYYSDKWAEYQINNANYANIFNRQIQNIDSMQKLEREQTRTQYGMNIATEFLGLGGGLKGASAGSAGGPWGALIGGAAGTVGGGAGAIAGAVLDERWMNWAQKENRSYAIDMYNYNLGNVKALPYGLAKSDALTENFKYFPFIEEYDCTDVEKDLYRQKLKYDGMTVGAIGNLESYIPTGPDWDFQMLKGRMIMADNITDDFHIVDAIYQEVLKGFYYINQYTEPEGEGE